MAIIRVKDKYQVTLPASVRKQLRLEVGDVLEAEVKGGKITLTPKVVVERGLMAALNDLENGRRYGPFASADELLRSLRRKAKKRRKGHERA